MECRPGCAACCIAPSISSPLPGHPNGKPAGVHCLHLSDTGLCELFDSVQRPAICSAFQATEELCGTTREQALDNIALLEQQTSS